VTTTLPKILHVEDDHQQIFVMKALLELHGFEAVSAECALGALQFMKDGQFDLALLDYDLPDMTDAQLAHEIRGTSPSLSIILLSGTPFLPPGELAYVDAFLAKGLPVDELLCTIASLAPASTAVLCWKF
jgi:CheY-like chemotaxis protein